MVAATKLNEKVRRLEDLHYFREDLELRKRHLQASLSERSKQRLAEKCPLAGDQLLDDLRSAGFTPESLPALSIAPLAVAAWASGSVTEDESQKALLAIFDCELFGNGPAIEMFRSWLRSKPSDNLTDLWEAYTLATRPEMSEAQWRQTGRRLWRQAHAIAMASGGMLGFGRICEAEQKVLDRIRRVFDLREV